MNLKNANGEIAGVIICTMRSNLRSFASLILQSFHYPSPLLTVANTLDPMVNISKGDGVKIGSDVDLGGTITLEDGSHVGDSCRLVGDIRVGKGTGINQESNIFGEVDIGSYAAIAPRTNIYESNHQTHFPSLQGTFYEQNFETTLESTSRGPIEIGSDIWIGVNSFILSGVTIGHGAVVGAGAVVTKDVPSYTIVGGNPAKPLKKRFPEDVCQALLKLSWWDWPESKINKNEDFFTTNVFDLSQEDIFSMIE